MSARIYMKDGYRNLRVLEIKHSLCKASALLTALIPLHLDFGAVLKAGLWEFRFPPRNMESLFPPTGAFLAPLPAHHFCPWHLCPYMQPTVHAVLLTPGPATPVSKSPHHAFGVSSS